MEPEVMSSVLASVSTRREKAGKAIAALHSHRNVITACITEWENLERSFGVTERALQQKFKELAEVEVEYDAKIQETRAALDKREESIAGREEASLARVKEQKDTALAAVSEELRKLDEERSKWRAEKGIPPPPPEEPDGHGKALAKDDVHMKPTPSKKADQDHIPSKEARNVQRAKGSGADLSSKNVHNVLQSTKNVDREAEIKPRKTDGNNQLEDISKLKRKDAIIANESAAKRQKEASEPYIKAAAAGSKGGALSVNAPSMAAIKVIKNAAEAPLLPQIKDPAVNQDYRSLKDYYPKGKKDIKEKLRISFLTALQSSQDPCRFTLNTVESSEASDVIFIADERSAIACPVLLECLSEVVADPVLGVDFPVIPSEVKEIARNLARRWFSFLESQTEELHHAPHAFLQLLATFGIGSDYNADDLLKYIIAISKDGMGPAICRSLGLAEKIPVVIERLIEKGKPFDAIGYASVFGLLDKCNPEVLVKTFIEESEKKIDAVKATAAASNMIELYISQILVFKRAIKILNGCKVDLQVPVEDLRTRLTALKQEKSKLKKLCSIVKRESKHNQALENVCFGSTDDTIKGKGEPGARPGLEPKQEMHGAPGARSGFEIAQGMHGSYISSAEQGRFAPPDLGRIVDYTPTDIGRPLFPPYNFDRFNGIPDSMYDNHGVGRRSPVSSNSNPYALRDALGPYPGSSSSVLPGFHSYTGMPRGNAEMPSSYSGPYGRAPYPETRGGLSSKYPIGTGLPPSSTYLPYHLR